MRQLCLFEVMGALRGGCALCDVEPVKCETGSAY